MPPRPERMDNFTGLKRRCEMFQDYKCLELNSFFGRCRATVLHCTRFSFTLCSFLSPTSRTHFWHFMFLQFQDTFSCLHVTHPHNDISTIRVMTRSLFDSEARTPITRVIVDRVLVQLHVSCDSVRKRSRFWQKNLELENVPAYH